MPTAIGRRFVYCHMPRTAGTTTYRALVTHGLADNHLAVDDTHARACVLTPGRKMVIAGMRSPFRWYLSFLAYQRSIGGAEGLLRPYIAAVGDADDDVIAAMVDPLGCGVRPTGWQQPPEEQLHGAGVSLFSLLYEMYYCVTWATEMPAAEVDARHDGLCLIDFAVDGDQLAQGLPAVLERCGEEVPGALVEQLQERGALHTGGGTRERDVYSDRTLRLIEDRDGWILRRYGYRFGEPAPRAWWRLRRACAVE